MIYEKDLDESIARYQGETNPSINTCIKLAACYALKHELFGDPEPVMDYGPAEDYSYAPAPVEPVETIIDYTSDTDFSRAINGRPAAEVWPIIDEMISTIQVLQPRLYDSVMRMVQR